MSNASRDRVARATHQLEWQQLAAPQRAAWLGFLRAHAVITRDLDAELAAHHGLPLASYDVLIQLATAPQRRLRMHELADAVLLSRSGLTRLVARLEAAGLVRRERGERDPRQVYAGITDSGLETLTAATPTHLGGVRQRFLDRLTAEQTDQLAAIWSALLPGSTAPPAPDRVS